MTFNNRKIIFILIPIFLAIILGTAFYLFQGKIKEWFGSAAPLGYPPYGTEEERKNCEKRFILTDDKIRWAAETAVPEFKEGDSQLKGLLMRTYLTPYFSCKAAISGKYEDCAPITANQDKDIEKNNQLVCYKTVWYKNVFLRLASDKKVSENILKSFTEYILKYAPADSGLKQGISEGKIKANEFLEAVMQKNGDICQGSGKASCQAALTRDGKYCQDFMDEKESCLAGVQFMKAIDLGNANKCGEIQDKDNILPLVCRLVLNQNPEHCASKDIIGKFAHQYCYFGF